MGKKKWLKFDLHMHSRHSDGVSSVREMILAAKTKGLDVIAITDHNLAVKIETEKIYKKYGIYVIPGCELSFFRGHFLVLGLEAEIVNKKIKEMGIRETTTTMMNRRKTIESLLQFFVKKGALVIAAHPKIPTGIMSARKSFLIKLYKKGLIHGAETHNGDLERKFGRRVYWVWHKMAKKTMIKLNMPPYADSDAHVASRVGYRYNKEKMTDPRKLLEVLKKGRIEIKHGTGGSLKSGDR